jgi:hypothetical protein
MRFQLAIVRLPTSNVVEFREAETTNSKSGGSNRQRRGWIAGRPFATDDY